MVKRILGSYRWRRRLAWIGGFLAVAVALVVTILLLPNGEANKLQATPTGTIPAQTVVQVIKQVRLTRADKRGVNRTLVAFVRTGVTRSDPAAAWDLVTPAMRSGVTRKEWNRGELPVLPFAGRIPDQPSWNVLTSYPGDVTIDLVVQPQNPKKHGPIAFAVDLKKTVRGGRWLIDSMIPEQAFEPAPSGGKSAKGAAAQQESRSSRERGNQWFYVIPGGLLALIVIVPTVFLLNNWRRHRAIERRYRAERGL
jgi:hypothetical protein